MGSDQNIDFTFLQLLQNHFLFFRRSKAGNHFDIDRQIGKTIFEIVVMLLRQKGGRHQNGYLAVIADR